MIFMTRKSYQNERFNVDFHSKFRRFELTCFFLLSAYPHTHTHTHTHIYIYIYIYIYTHIYIYIYMCVCVCICVCVYSKCHPILYISISRTFFFKGFDFIEDKCFKMCTLRLPYFHKKKNVRYY